MKHSFIHNGTTSLSIQLVCSPNDTAQDIGLYVRAVEEDLREKWNNHILTKSK